MQKFNGKHMLHQTGPYADGTKARMAATKYTEQAAKRAQQRASIFTSRNPEADVPLIFLGNLFGFSPRAASFAMDSSIGAASFAAVALKDASPAFRNTVLPAMLLVAAIAISGCGGGGGGSPPPIPPSPTTTVSVTSGSINRPVSRQGPATAQSSCSPADATKSFSWKVNDTAAGTGPSLAPENFRKGDVVGVTFGCSKDGVTATGTDETTVLESPSIFTPDIPSTVRTGSTLTVSVTFSDADPEDAPTKLFFNYSLGELINTVALAQDRSNPYRWYANIPAPASEEALITYWFKTMVMSGGLEVDSQRSDNYTLTQLFDLTGSYNYVLSQVQTRLQALGVLPGDIDVLPGQSVEVSELGTGQTLNITNAISTMLTPGYSGKNFYVYLPENIDAIDPNLTITENGSSRSVSVRDAISFATGYTDIIFVPAQTGAEMLAAIQAAL